ncbi:hypothetical protein CL654_02525 [bacterium]|nr:hypothetical protein [bacterium]|tara:strand:+ start:2094 stop:2828 length:735 start_codon:yes stop_codon:yes gene_type:complete
MTETFTARVGEFEGPLELLLDLIEKKQLSINEVSLKEVADGYIEHLQKLENLPIAQTAHFLLVASALLLLKSLSLLPTLELSEEEEQSIEELEKRLRDYKEIKRLSEHIDKQYGKRKIFWGKRSFTPEPFFSPDERTNVNELSSLLASCLKTLPGTEKTPEATIAKVMSLEEMIDNLREKVQVSLSTSFKKISGHKEEPMGKEEKLNVVVSFLAILELVKQEVVHATQSEKFDDITIETHKQEA